LPGNCACSHRIAAIQGEARRENRLVLDVRVDAIAVAARHVGGGQQPQAGMRPLEGSHVAQGEARMGVRGADGAQEQRTGGHPVCAEVGAAVELACPVHPREPRAHRARLGQRAGAANRLDDAAIAGAAAQHAAQRRLHLRLARRGVPAQQLDRGDDHAGRADAALRRTGRVEARHQRLPFRCGGDALDRFDHRALALAERDEAGAGLRAVQQHCAGAAISGIAADLRAGQAQPLAQRLRKPGGRRQRQLARRTVQGEPRDAHRCHVPVIHAASRARARATSSAAAAWR
jgi:hypothetical protein